MEINFEIFNHLAKSSSKKYIKKLFQYALYVKSSFRSFNDQYKTPVSENLASDLELEESQAEELLINLGKLIDLCGVNSFNNLEALFPENFNQAIKGMLIELISSMQDKIIKFTDNRLTQAEKLISLDWRIDLQLSNQSNKSNKPIVFMTLETLDGCTPKTTSFQLKPQQLLAFHQNLKKIKQQLNLLVS